MDDDNEDDDVPAMSPHMLSTASVDTLLPPSGPHQASQADLIAGLSDAHAPSQQLNAHLPPDHMPSPSQQYGSPQTTDSALPADTQPRQLESQQQADTRQHSGPSHPTGPSPQPGGVTPGVMHSSPVTAPSLQSGQSRGADAGSTARAVSGQQDGSSQGMNTSRSDDLPAIATEAVPRHQLYDSLEHGPVHTQALPLPTQHLEQLHRPGQALLPTEQRLEEGSGRYRPDTGFSDRQHQAPQFASEPKANAQPEQPGVAGSPRQDSALPVPVEGSPSPPSSAEVPSRPDWEAALPLKGQSSMPVPRRPPPSRPSLDEQLAEQGNMLVPKRPAPTRPDLDSALSLEGQGSMPTPRRPAPSRPGLASDLPLQGQDSAPRSAQGFGPASRPGPGPAPPLGGQDSVHEQRQGLTSRPSPGPALPLEGTVPQPGLTPSSMMPQDLPPRAELATRHSGQSSQLQGPSQLPGLEGMLGRAAPDTEDEEEESEASAQDRQKFMQSLQSPDRGSTRTKNLAKGFGRMRAKAKDMLQARNAGGASAGPAGQTAPAQGTSKEALQTPTDAELGRGSRLARDMTMMFAGLKKPTTQ